MAFVRALVTSGQHVRLVCWAEEEKPDLPVYSTSRVHHGSMREARGRLRAQTMSYSSATQSVAGGRLHGHRLASPVYIPEMQALRLRPWYDQPFNQSLREFCTAKILSPTHMEKEWGEIIKQLSILSTMRCEPASLYNKFLFSPQKPFQTLLPLGPSGVLPPGQPNQLPPVWTFTLHGK